MTHSIRRRISDRPLITAGIIGGIIAIILFALSIAITPKANAAPKESQTRTVTWYMPGSTGKATYPQEYVEGVPACGDGWYQIDVYKQDTVKQQEQLSAILADWKLTKGEDKGLVKSWSIEQPLERCEEEPPAPTVVTPLPPTFDDLCGTDNDVTNIPDNTAEVTYTGLVANTDGAVTASVTATANEGFVFEGGSYVVWSFIFSNDECPVTTAPPVTAPPVVTPPAAAVTPPTVVVTAPRTALPETR